MWVLINIFSIRKNSSLEEISLMDTETFKIAWILILRDGITFVGKNSDNYREVLFYILISCFIEKSRIYSFNDKYCVRRNLKCDEFRFFL